MIFIANFFSHHPPCSTTHPSSQKTATAGLCMRRVSLPTRCQVGTRLLHVSFLPAQLGSNHHRFPTRAQKGQKSSAALPPAARLLSPVPPRDGVLRVRRGTLHPPSNSENDANQIISKNTNSIVFHESVVYVINTLDRATGTQAPRSLVHPQPHLSVCTSSGGKCPCEGCGARPRSPADSSAPCTSSCASSRLVSGRRGSSRRCSCTGRKVWREGSCKRRICEPA